MHLKISGIAEKFVKVEWEPVSADSYKVFWADADTPGMKYKKVQESGECGYTLKKSTHIPHYLYVEAYKGGELVCKSETLKTPIHCRLNEQLEKLNRGLIAVKLNTGIFLSWRMLLEEVSGYGETGMTGTDYVVYRNGEKIATVTDSTNYLDKEG